jgi:hypothetical protein
LIIFPGTNVYFSVDYHIILMSICQPFIHEKWSNELSPRDIISDAERDMNVLMRLYYLRHGFEHTDVYLASPLSKLGFMSLQSINSQPLEGELDYSRSTLLLALTGLRDQSCNHNVARTIYRILKNQFRPEEAGLLHGSNDIEAESDESSALIDQVQATWTPCAINISDDHVVQGLSKLAKQFLKLDLGDQSDTRTDNSSPLST